MRTSSGWSTRALTIFDSSVQTDESMASMGIRHIVPESRCALASESAARRPSSASTTGSFPLAYFDRHRLPRGREVSTPMLFESSLSCSSALAVISNQSGCTLAASNHCGIADESPNSTLYSTLPLFSGIPIILPRTTDWSRRTFTISPTFTG